MENIEIHPSTKWGLISLLENPIQLFGHVYQLLEPQLGTISNSIFIAPNTRFRFNMLSDFFLKIFQKIYSTAAKPQFLGEVKLTIINEDDIHLLLLSLFKGISDYLTLYRKRSLKTLKPIKVHNIIITPKPPNPIHDLLPNPIRENYGTGFHDLTDIFKYISVIKETNLKINFIKNDRLTGTCSYLKNKIRNGFKIAVTPFMIDIVFEFDSHLNNWPAKEKTPYWLKKIRNTEEAQKCLIDKVLKPCLQKEVDILVLPELSVDERLLTFLKNWLKLNNRERISSGKPGLLLVVAGSFHFEIEGNKRFNISTVLNHEGDVLWTQNKIKRFSFDKSDIRKNPQLPILLETSPAGGYEGIKETGTICCVDTPLGRIAVCICIDFFHKEHMETFRQAGINVFLVPAMSPQIIRFLESAALFAGDNLAASFISNNGYAAKKGSSGIHEDGASFYILPNRSRKNVQAASENLSLLVFDSKKLTKS
jgi:predicted amidohydrolase